MRVVGGSARGVALRTPKGSGVRPTMDKVRVALFNILAALGLKDAAVADFFAGTGSLGIEALSRGAAHVDFVEANAPQCADIRVNLQVTKLADRATVLHSTVEKALEQMDNKYDFVLMDPPYKMKDLAPVLKVIGETKILEADGMVVVGHSKHSNLSDTYGNLSRFDSRRYGDSVVEFFQWTEIV